MLIKNIPLPEQFKNPIAKSQGEAKSIPIKQKYMTAHLSEKYMTAHLSEKYTTTNLSEKYMTAHLSEKYMNAH